jgi:hypothetical protein
MYPISVLFLEFFIVIENDELGTALLKANLIQSVVFEQTAPWLKEGLTEHLVSPSVILVLETITFPGLPLKLPSKSFITTSQFHLCKVLYLTFIKLIRLKFVVHPPQRSLFKLKILYGDSICINNFK